MKSVARKHSSTHPLPPRRRQAASALLESLSAIRGRVEPQAPLGRRCWLGAGGEADILLVPADSKDLQTALRHCPDGVDVHVVGAGSNLIVRDGGVPGLVVRLGGAFAGLEFTRNYIRAGASLPAPRLAAACLEHECGGLEFLSGIPGTCGGVASMNAGAFGRAASECLLALRAVDRSGSLHELKAEDCAFGYRCGGLPRGWIVVETVWRRLHAPRDAISARMDAMRGRRRRAQPTKGRTAGSTFTNPPGEKAWRLIERAGCRGLRRGGAFMSRRHCNFMVNDGGACACDFEDLGEEVRRRVCEATGVTLRWELRRIGVALSPLSPSAPPLPRERLC